MSARDLMPAENIAQNFCTQMKDCAKQRGLTCKRVHFFRAKRTLAILEGDPNERNCLWVLYYKVSTVQEPRKPWWGLTGKILDYLQEASVGHGCRWGVVLLEGNAENPYFERGYFLQSQDIAQRKESWTCVGDEYKVYRKQPDNWVKIVFRNVGELFDKLEIAVN